MIPSERNLLKPGFLPPDIRDISKDKGEIRKAIAASALFIPIVGLDRAQHQRLQVRRLRRGASAACPPPVTGWSNP
jgi:hypothetical protein